MNVNSAEWGVTAVEIFEFAVGNRTLVPRWDDTALSGRARLVSCALCASSEVFQRTGSQAGPRSLRCGLPCRSAVDGGAHQRPAQAGSRQFGGCLARPGVPCRPRNYYDHQHHSTMMTITEPKHPSSTARSHVCVVSFELPRSPKPRMPNRFK